MTVGQRALWRQSACFTRKIRAITLGISFRLTLREVRIKDLSYDERRSFSTQPR